MRDDNNRSTWINPNTATVTTVSSHVLDANNYCTASNIPTTKPTPTQEHKMNKFTVIANFEESISKVLESLTLDDFVTEIAAKEAEIKALKSLKNKPNAVVDKIEQLKHDIDILIIQCDTLIK